MQSRRKSKKKRHLLNPSEGEINDNEVLSLSSSASSRAVYVVLSTVEPLSLWYKDKCSPGMEVRSLWEDIYNFSNRQVAYCL